MMNLRATLQNTHMFVKDSRFRQSSLLLFAMIFAMGVNLIVSILVARTLGPEEYGDVKFIQTIWALLTLLSSLGYFYSGSQILVMEKVPENIREITGTILLISFLIGICLNIFTAIIAVPIDLFFHTHVSNIMISLAPLVFVLSTQAALMLILQGINRIYLLSILTAVPVLLYLISISLLSYLKLISAKNVLLSTQGSYLIVILFIILCLQPSFKSTRRWWVAIREKNKTYGGPVYLGSLANVATSYLNRLAISYWTDNTSIGFYSLASSLTEPLKLIPNAVATSSFRNFARQKEIPKRLIYATVGFSTVALILALLFFGEPLSWAYTENFAPVGLMSRVLSVAAIMIGFGDFFNRFLGAHGKGKALRDTAYIMGGVNIAGFFLLVPRWGIWGLISTSILAGLAYFIFILIYYRKLVTTMISDFTYTTQNDINSKVTDNGAEIHKKTSGVYKDSGRKGKREFNIIILLDSFGFPYGMASTRRVELIARILAKNGFQVKVLCARALEKRPVVINNESQGVHEGIFYEYTPGTTIRSDKFMIRRYLDIKGIVIALVRLATYRINHQADCIYYYGNIMDNTLNRWIFYLAARILGVPLVTDISEPPWVFNQNVNWFDCIFSPLTGVRGVILISKFLEDWVTSETSKIKKRVPYLHLPILINTNEYKYVESKSCKQKMAVLFAGLDPKSIKFIIQAMERVWSVYPDCKLIITGFESGSLEKSWLDTLSQQYSIREKVEITGYLPRSELHLLYQNVSALLIPMFSDIRSQARFPTKIAEYLFSGTPIVTCRVGEIDQFLKDGVTAFISDPDEIENYAQRIIDAVNPQNWNKAHEIGLNGREVVIANFDVDVYMKPIINFFSSICAQTDSRI
ncbi:MAG TPA: glycosyltransferase [Stenomitos sp.]